MTCFCCFPFKYPNRSHSNPGGIREFLLKFQSRRPRAARHWEAVIISPVRPKSVSRVNSIVFRLTPHRFALYCYSDLRSRRRSNITQCSHRRRYFIGGSDARIIMGDDEAALLRLWREKRGEVEPEDLSATSSSSSVLRPKT